MSPKISELLDEPEEDEEEEEVKEEKKAIPEIPNWLRRLWADSPDKDVEEYENHPLNYDKKKSTSRIIRGAEGIVGDMDKAVIDVIIGVIMKISEWIKRPQKEVISTE